MSEPLQIMQLDALNELTESFYVAGQKTQGVMGKRFNLKPIFDAIVNLTNGSAIISQNELIITDHTTYLTAEFSPATIDYKVNGIAKSIISSPINLNAKPAEFSRFDLIYINTNAEPNVITVKTGTVDESPVQPTLLSGELLIAYAYINAEEIVPVASDGEKVVYVGKHGLDSNDGLTIEKAVKSFDVAQGIMTAKGRKVLRCVDDSVLYTTAFLSSGTSSNPVIYDCPNATITKLGAIGNIVIPSNTHIRSKRLTASFSITNATNVVIDTQLVTNLTIDGTSVVNILGNPSFTVLLILNTATLYCGSLKATTLTIGTTANVYGFINGLEGGRPYMDILNLDSTDINAGKLIATIGSKTIVTSTGLQVGDINSYSVIEVQIIGGGTITANPPISDGQEGQMILLKGVSDVNTVTFPHITDVFSLYSSSSVTLGKNKFILMLFTSASKWIEVFRSKNIA